MINIILFIVTIDYIQKRSCGFYTSNFNKSEQSLLNLILILAILNIIEESQQLPPLIKNVEVPQKNIIKKDTNLENSWQNELEAFKNLNEQEKLSDNISIESIPSTKNHEYNEDEKEKTIQINNSESNSELLKIEKNISTNDINKNQEENQTIIEHYTNIEQSENIKEENHSSKNTDMTEENFKEDSKKNSKEDFNEDSKKDSKEDANNNELFKLEEIIPILENKLTKLLPIGIEELKVFGTPIKELTKEKESAFQELPSIKDILNSLKELTSQKGFDELSTIKDIFTPIKELIQKDEETSKQQNKKEKSHK